MQLLASGLNGRGRLRPFPSEANVIAILNAAQVDAGVIAKR